MIKFKEQDMFTDSLAKYFPEERININSEFFGAKTITFQITDECNLCCSYCY